ncbi:hypothetical protein [Thioclava sp. IC9]|uniref:hypothetical protein n=1 Tax=Thioclava sp. IC9 TaxID=1973007 RepID=UPI000B53CE31|nr:hypothetical protein [Thioclava sp. IC9]OWY02065.1 hypothetical protein B6V76_11535 [Thioclava sp. IC9]
MTEKRTIQDIENRLRQDRADLASTLGDLTARIAPDYLSEQVSQAVRDYAAPAARSAEQAVRKNPVAFALAGAGIAWFLLRQRNSESIEEEDLVADADPLVMPSDAGADGWIDEIDTLRHDASVRLEDLEAEQRSSTDKARDFVKERSEVMQKFASDLRNTLSSGLSDLNEDARDRVVRARERAYSARIRLHDGATHAGSTSKQMVKDHPLIAAAIGFAVGAAIFNAVPKPDVNVSRRSFGPRANRLFNEAERLYRDEKRRAGKVADQFTDELKRTARSVMSSAGDEARSAARDFGDQAMAAGEQLIDRLSRQLAEEANRALRDVGQSLQKGEDEVRAGAQEAKDAARAKAEDVASKAEAKTHEAAEKVKANHSSSSSSSTSSTGSGSSGAGSTGGGSASSSSSKATH